MRYIVENENLLGYVTDKSVYLWSDKAAKVVSMVVMRADVEKGGDPTLVDRKTVATNYRNATKEDFENFGIVPPKDI